MYISEVLKTDNSEKHSYLTTIIKTNCSSDKGDNITNVEIAVWFMNQGIVIAVLLYCRHSAGNRIGFIFV